MAAHPLDGHVHSTAMHGRTCPCVCAGPTDLDGVPADCQADRLAADAALAGLSSGTPRDAAAARFRCYRAWARDVGIWGVRVAPPPCVRRLVESRYGSSRRGFVAGENVCPCATCENARAGVSD